MNERASYILWLPSWYPNKLDAFEGDFIQRHAYAAALYNKIFALKVVGDKTGSVTKSIKTDIRKTGNLTEYLVYFKRSSSLMGKIIARYRERKLYRTAISELFRETGLPAGVHVHVPVRAGHVALWIRKKYQVGFVVTEHLGIYNDVVNDRYERRSWYFRSLTKTIVLRAAHFVSVSRFLGEQVNRLVANKEYSVIPNVVDTSSFFYIPAIHQPFRFIHVSNMVSLKNVEGILDAAAGLGKTGEKFELVLVGNKDNSMVGFAKKLGIANVVFRGEIPYTKVAEEMQRSNALILFSNMENSPCVIAEAHCCGLPVIATDVGGIPELVTGKDGQLIKAGDINHLREAMKAMMRNYASYDRRAISVEASARFSYDAVGRMFDELYRRWFALVSTTMESDR